jgi:retron-type reverse transcriptase
MYKTIYIPKKSGGFREISIPNPELKEKQREILEKLYNYFVNDRERYKSFFYFAKGFIPNKGIYHNANPHAGKKFILNIDIKDFFPSCKEKNLPNYIKQALSQDEINLLFHNDSLPQGAPTSPFVSNLYLADADGIIFYLLKVFISDDVIYTRYADDITISSNSKAIFGKTCLKIIDSVLKRYGFQIHPEKIRRLTPSQKQEITGLCVNSGKPTVSRKIRRLVRAMVHNMTKKQEVTEQELNRVKGLISFINQCPAHKSWCKDMMEKIKKIKKVVNHENI